jgi:heat shock protein HspQ
LIEKSRVFLDRIVIAAKRIDVASVNHKERLDVVVRHGVELLKGIVIDMDAGLVYKEDLVDNVCLDHGVQANKIFGRSIGELHFFRK